MKQCWLSFAVVLIILLVFTSCSRSSVPAPAPAPTSIPESVTEPVSEKPTTPSSTTKPTPAPTTSPAPEPEVIQVSGTISEDTTWSGNILIKPPGASVAPGITLRIEPGATVSFEYTRRGYEAGLYVYGTLIAAGTADRPIRFTSDAPQPEHGDWNGIHAYPGSAGSMFDHCIIEYGWVGIYVEDNITLSNSIVRWTTGCPLPLYSTCTITGNRIYESGHNCIEVHYQAEPTITYNTLWGATQWAGIQVESYAHPIIRHNIIRDNKGPGISVCWSSSATIEYNTITGNGYSGICLDETSLISKTIIHHNNIYNNQGPQQATENIRLGVTEGSIDATDNWYGTADEEEIKAGLLHNPPVAAIVYKPYLTSEVDIGVGVYDFENYETYAHLPETENDTYAYVFTEDDESRKVVDSWKSPHTPCGITWDGEYLWLATLPQIHKLDAEGNIIASFPNPATQTMGLAFDGQFLWVMDYAERLVYQLDRSGNVIKSIPAPCAEPQGLTYDGEYLWTLTNEMRGIAYRFDAEGTVVGTLDTGGYSGLAWDGKYLWINGGAADALCQIDPATGHLIRAITPSGVATQYLGWQDPYLWCCEWADELPEHTRLVKLLPAEEIITLDGLTNDWQGISPLMEDPQGDFTGGETDIKATYGFIDDGYLYFMVEFFELARYHHLDIYIDFNGDGNPEYAVWGFTPQRPPLPGLHLLDYLRDEKKVGMFDVGYSALEVGCNSQEVLELKVPTWFFEDKTEFYIRCSLAGQFDGECYPVDETDWAYVSKE